jgi:hypothetical protein
MRVGSTEQVSFSGGRVNSRDAVSAPAKQDKNSRALVVATPADAQARTVNYRQAPFLAHLIATKDQFPQTRQRRRAEPTEAIAAYRAVEAITANR